MRVCVGAGQSKIKVEAKWKEVSVKIDDFLDCHFEHEIRWQSDMIGSSLKLQILNSKKIFDATW